jgi:hypothetical protein
MIVACVRTGTVYSFDYVTKLRNMVGRHLRRPYSMVCLTDQPDRCEGVEFIDITAAGLPGWWAKLLLFEPTWRNHNRVIYVDVDTVIIGDLSPLADVPGEFAICENFTRLLTKPSYPCRYNSSVMVIGGGMAGFVWDRFAKHSKSLMEEHARYGDQACIEALYPDAPFLQRLLPKNFFFNYRQLTMHKPNAAMVNFGGSNKPHTCPIPWVQREWS